jgi:hypothetical protein
LPDQSVAGYTEVTWAEDRATRGRDPSAEPGAKTGVGGRTPPLGIPGIGRKAINPITCICISEWRSENQGLSRARRAGKVAGSKAIMPGCMRLRRTTCAALMVLQKRPCFCSPAARPDICPDLGGVGPDLARQEVEARFIHENQGAALAAGLVLEPRPDLDSPLLDLLLVALDGPRNRQLGRPAQFLQKPGDVTLVVGDAELLFDDLGDAGTGPDLAAKAVGFRPVRQEVGDETQLIRFELGGRAEVGSREQRSRTFAARRRNPPAYRPLGDTEGDGDLPLLPTELLEAPGLHSLPLSPVLRVGALGVHALLYGPKNFTFLRNAQ